jgi:hypothetical protein
VCPLITGTCWQLELHKLATYVLQCYPTWDNTNEDKAARLITPVKDNADLVPYDQQKHPGLIEESAYVAFWAMNLNADMTLLDRPAVRLRYTTSHQYISHIHHRLSGSINTESAARVYVWLSW